jgi:hypothetical protein
MVEVTYSHLGEIFWRQHAISQSLPQLAPGIAHRFRPEVPSLTCGSLEVECAVVVPLNVGETSMVLKRTQRAADTVANSGAQLAEVIMKTFRDVV